MWFEQWEPFLNKVKCYLNKWESSLNKMKCELKNDIHFWNMKTILEWNEMNFKEWEPSLNRMKCDLNYENYS